MRVLFASTYPHLPDIVGGLQTTTDDLCLALRDAGIEVAVLCGMFEHAHNISLRRPAQRDNSLGYPVIRVADPVASLQAVVASWEPSVIVVQSGTTLLPMAVASLESGYPTAVYLHNVEVHQLGGHLVPDSELLYLANSSFTACRLRALAGINCVVIPPLVVAERYFTPTTGDQVLYVNPSQIKGIEIMFSLAHACPEIPFLIVESWGLNPNWREYCLGRANKLPNVTWRQPTSDMRTIYSQCRTLLMPSIWEESFGRTVIEAQISGIPVVASRRGALPDTVGKGGLLIDLEEPIEVWIDALRQAYRHSPEYDSLSSLARENAYKIASAPLILANLMTALASHVSRHRRQ